MEPAEIAGMGGAGTLLLLAQKVLGPTAAYLGDELRLFTQKRIENIRRIFEFADRKQKPNLGPGSSVPPKVVKGVFDDGSFCDDELSAEYFGGVLASSRSDVSRDDRGASMLSLLGRLSSYEIRTHFIIYSTLKRLFDGSGLIIGDPEVRQQTAIFIPWSAYLQAMEVSESEDGPAIVNYAMFGLERESLIDPGFLFGDQGSLQAAFRGATESGIIVRPANHGALLFMWAHGRSDLRIGSFFDSEVPLESETSVHIPAGSLKCWDTPSG